MSQQKLALLLAIALILGVSNHVLINQYFKYKEEEARVLGEDAIIQLRIKHYRNQKKRDQQSDSGNGLSGSEEEVPEIIPLNGVQPDAQNGNSQHVIGR